MLTQQIVRSKKAQVDDLRRLLNYNGAISPASGELYFYVLKKFNRWLAEQGLSWEGITRRVLVDYMEFQRGQGLKNGSINTSLKSIKRLFAALIDAGKTDANPAEGLAFLKENEQARKAKGKFLDVPQIQAMLEAARAKGGEAAVRDEAVLTTLVYSGVRASELCGLRWRNLNDEIEVEHGKGDKPRLVENCAKIREALGRYRAVLEGAGVVIEKDSPIFWTIPTARFTQRRPMNRHSLYNMVKRLGRQAGVKAWPHGLRHSFASLALRGGANIISISHRLGHSSPALTMSTYLWTDDACVNYLPEMG